MGSGYVMYQGDTSPVLTPQFADGLGNPIALTGVTAANFAMKMQSISDRTQIKTCAGAWSISNGQASYQWLSADTSAVGGWMMYITVSFPTTGPETFVFELDILPHP